MRVRVEVRRGEVDAPRGEEPIVELDLAETETLVGFEARPNVARPQIGAGPAVIAWRWKAYVAVTPPAPRDPTVVSR